MIQTVSCTEKFVPAPLTPLINGGTSIYIIICAYYIYIYLFIQFTLHLVQKKWLDGLCQI